MLRIETNDAILTDKAERVALLVQDGAFDRPVEIAAWKCYAELVLLTPKKWTGNLRRNWKVSRPALGSRLVFNNSKVMKFIEGGTGNAGTPTSNGGYIYPKTKKVLYIPLNARAAIGGWNRGLVFGRDYVLARRARGIVARHIVRNFRPRAGEILRAEMKSFLQEALK
jgi:hypothetical protein